MVLLAPRFADALKDEGENATEMIFCGATSTLLIPKVMTRLPVTDRLQQEFNYFSLKRSTDRRVSLNRSQAEP